MSSDQRESGVEASVQKDGKQPYSPPRLTVYGDVAKLTQNVGTVGSDGITGSRLV
jgi:hypothetical protein